MSFLFSIACWKLMIDQTTASGRFDEDNNGSDGSDDHMLFSLLIVIDEVRK